MNAAYVTEQNKVAASGAWLWLMEITTTGYSTLRYTNNNDDVDWPSSGGNTYSKMPFTIDDVRESIAGEFPEYKLYVGDVDPSSTLRARIAATSGLVGSRVRLMIVHSDHLTLTTAAVDETAEILGCELTVEGVTLTIGIPSLLTRRFPRDKYVPGFCRHKFGGALCKYQQPTSAALTSNQISFVPAAGAIDYDEIRDAGSNLVTGVFEAAPGARVTAGTNLITNGLFANGTQGTVAGWSGGRSPSDWTLWGSAGDAARRWSWSRAKYGSRSYYHRSTNLNSGILQTVAVNSGVSYTFSCWVWTDATTSIRMMTRVKVGGVWSYSAAYSTANIGWERLTLTAVPYSGNDGELTVWLGGVGRAYFDAVNIVQGPDADDFTRYELDADTGFTISGSEHNDGFYIADSYYQVSEDWVRAFDIVDETFVAESAGEIVTVTLGYSGCDHTLEACRKRDNSQNFGGSPGIVGGIYG